MIFFSDMDGTLLTSDKRITPETWAALDAIHDTGMQFVPAQRAPSTACRRSF